MYIYFFSQNVSDSHMSIIRRITCINTTSDICHSVVMTLWYAGLDFIQIMLYVTSGGTFIFRIDNKHRISCIFWFISLHPTFHDARSQETKTRIFQFLTFINVCMDYSLNFRVVLCDTWWHAPHLLRKASLKYNACWWSVGEWDMIFAAEFLNCVFLGRCPNDWGSGYIMNVNKWIVHKLWL